MGQASEKRNILEQITFFTGLLVLLALFGYLGYQLTQNSGKPPALYITTAYKPQMKDYSFEVQVENRGQITAEAAKIQLDLYQEGESVEAVTLEFRYVPAGSKESGWAAFSRSRKPGDSLVVSAVTYAKP